MNTIQIYLKSSGSVAQLVKDFPVYVGSYKTNYVKVYVLPTMMPSGENVGYGLGLSGKYTLDNGQEFISEPFWLNRLEDESIVVGDVSTTYHVFGGWLPRKLSKFAGNQILILNLQQIDTETGEFISVITTQECHLLIQRSAYISVDENIEPNSYELINERVTTNENDINNLEVDITNINTRIDNLPLSEDYIGSFSGTTQPFDDGEITQEMIDLLDAKVVEIKGASYVKKNGDVLIYTYQIAGETDKNYRFIYTTNDTWTGYEIPALEVAGNGSLGIVEGTVGTGSNNDILVDIQSGQIKNIKFKENGNYVDINTIPSTYMTQSAGATKNYVRDYSLPRQFNDIYYVASDGYKTSAPTSPSSGIQFTATSSSVGDTELFTCAYTNTADFELSQKNSTNNSVYIKATANATVQFRMTTQYRKNGEATWNDLSIELTGDVVLIANSLQKVQFASAMTELGDQMITMTTGDEIRQIMEVVTETSETISFEIYSSSTYPSILNLNTQLATLVLGNLLDRFEGSNYVSVAENEANTKIEIKIPDDKVENTTLTNGSDKLTTSNVVYNATKIDNTSITRNASGQLQSSKLKDKDVKVSNNSVTKTDFNGVVELPSDQAYEELKANGTIVVDGQTIVFDGSTLYTTPDDASTNTVYTKAETDALLDEKLDKKPDGTHDLIDANNKITETYLPDFILGQLIYGGTFNATTAVATLSDNAKTKLGTASNTITLTNDTTAITGYQANEDIFYVTQTAGTFASISFDVGDWLLSNGSAWERIANADAVTGVKGNAEVNYRIGQVNITPANIGSYSTSETDTLLDGKLDKVTSTNANKRVYGVNTTGTQEMETLESGTGVSAPTGNTIALRGSNGEITTGSPTQDYHATPKTYVDTNFVPKSREVAGVDLEDDITKSELATALGIDADLNINNGEGTNSLKMKNNNTVSGNNSFAEGTNNVVFSNNSHAEGYSVTKATSRGITASSTDAEIEAEWLASDPEGDKFSLVKGENGHIEGSNCLALGQNTHAEGNGTRATNNSAHAEGTGTLASGKYSHAEGLETIASGGRAHTEGDSTQATADYTHAEGRGTRALGKYAHTEGRGSTVSANAEYSHAEGRDTLVSHSYCHTSGQNTTTSATHQTVVGLYNDSDSSAKFIVGTGSSGSLRNSFATGYDGTESFIKVGTTKFRESEIAKKSDISTAIANVYKVQGSETVSNLNSTTKTESMNGYVYNISTGGTLNNQDASTLAVNAGDNVVFIWNNGSWYWDKLASDIDLSGYVPKTTTIAGVDLQDNITASELKTAMSLPSSIEGTANGSIIMNDITHNVSSGAYGLAEGCETTASGVLGSHSEGYRTTASGPHSHAEGELATASGQDSHAEGWYSTASGYGTHAEGGRCSATFEFAHAEGQYATANGFASHAEGCQTTTGAVARQSHTEGYFCQSHNYQSHSEGDYSIAGFNDDTVATFDISATYAENTVVKNGTGLYYLCIKASTGNALDNTTYWNLIQSNHAEGQNTRSTSLASHAEGVNSIASGKASHAEGNGTYATNNASHSEGTGSQATGKYSHAEGLESVASGSRSHAEGYQTTASGDSAHAQGRDTVASGKYSSASGRGTTASKENQTAVGQYNATDNEALFIVGTGSKSGDTINARNSFAAGHDGTASFIKVGTTKFRENELAKKTDISSFFTAITGYDATKTQVLKNIQGTLTWVDEV